MSRKTSALVFVALALSCAFAGTRAQGPPSAVVAAMKNDLKFFDDAAIAREGDDLKEFINRADHDHGRTAVMMATIYGHHELLDKLLTLGADGKALDHEGHSAVDAAATLGSIEALNILKNHGLDLWSQSRDGFTPLHRTSWGTNETHLAAVKYLVEECLVDVNTPDSSGRPATVLAVERGNVAVLKQLLDLGAKVEHMNKRGDSLLTIAVRKQHAETVDLLLKRGANVLVTDSKGRNLRKLAKLLRSKEILKLISDAYAEATKLHGDTEGEL